MPIITFIPVANFGDHPLSNVKKVGDLKKNCGLLRISELYYTKY